MLLLKQRLNTRPINGRSNKDNLISEENYDLVAFKTSLMIFSHNSWSFQYWIRCKSICMCRTRETPRIQLNCNNPSYSLCEKHLLRIHSDCLVCLFFLLSSPDRPRVPMMLSISISRYSKSIFSRASSLFFYMRAWTNKCWLEADAYLKKKSFSTFASLFQISIVTEIFLKSCLNFLSFFFLYFASLPQLRRKRKLLNSGTRLNWKCSITERSKDFSWNSDYSQTW